MSVNFLVCLNCWVWVGIGPSRNREGQGDGLLRPDLEFNVVRHICVDGCDLFGLVRFIVSGGLLGPHFDIKVVEIVCICRFNSCQVNILVCLNFGYGLELDPLGTERVMGLHHWDQILSSRL